VAFLRYLLLVILALFAVRVLRAAFHPFRRRPSRPVGTGGGGGDGPERLVQDPVCGLLLPESQALREGEGFFCSEECRQASHAH